MDRGLEGDTGRTILNMIEADANRPNKVRTNPVVERELFRRIHLPDGDPKKIIETEAIYKEYIKGNLDDAARDNLRKELIESRDPQGSVFGREKADFLKRMEPQILKPGPFGIYADPTTPEWMFKYKQDLETQIRLYRELGKDPRVLFNPRSSEYFGAPEIVNKYQNSSFGSVGASTASPTPSVAPTARKPLSDIFK
jgi:hypothetical protein